MALICFLQALKKQEKKFENERSVMYNAAMKQSRSQWEKFCQLQYENQNVQEQVQNLQIESSHYQRKLHQLMEKSKDYHVQIQQLGETNKDLRDQIQQLDKENSLKSGKMDLQIHKDNKQLKKQNASYKAEIQQLQADAVLTKDPRQLKKQKAVYTSQIQQLKADAKDHKAQIQQLKADAKDHKAQIHKWQEETTQARVQIKTLTAQISTMEKELTDLRFMTQYKDLQHVTEWKKLIISFEHLQGEYAQEFVHLVEKAAEIFRENEQQNLYFTIEHQRVAQEIERRRIRFEEKYSHCNQLKPILYSWEWNNHVHDTQRMKADACRLEKISDQSRQEVNNKIMLHKEKFVKNLNLLLSQFSELELRCGFLMRGIASSVEPKQHLDRLFGNIAQEKVFKALSEETDEQWKKKYNKLKDQIDQWKKKYNDLKDQTDDQWKKKYNKLKDQTDDQWKKKYEDLKEKCEQGYAIVVLVGIVIGILFLY